MRRHPPLLRQTPWSLYTVLHFSPNCFCVRRSLVTLGILLFKRRFFPTVTNNCKIIVLLASRCGRHEGSACNPQKASFNIDFRAVSMHEIHRPKSSLAATRRPIIIVLPNTRSNGNRWIEFIDCAFEFRSSTRYLFNSVEYESSKSACQLPRNLTYIYITHIYIYIFRPKARL